MKHFILLFSCCCFVLKVNAQEAVAGLVNPYKSSTKVEAPINAFIVDDNLNKEKGLFAIYRDYVQASFFDENWEIIGKSLVQDYSIKNKTLIGYSLQGNIYNLLLSSGSKRKFEVLQFNFETGESEVLETHFKRTDGIFLAAKVMHNKCYVLSIDRKEPVIHILVFDENFNQPQKHSIAINEQSFQENISSDKRISLKTVLSGQKSDITIALPNAIEETSKEIKLYKDYKDRILVTSNVFKDFTYLIDIDLRNFEAEVSVFEMPLAGAKNMLNKGNSFLHKNHLFLFQSIPDQFSIQIFDKDTQVEKYSKTYSKEETIDIANTPITQEIGVQKKTRELDKTKQFLRKTVNASAGITVLEKENGYEVSYGSSKNLGDPNMVIFGGIMGGAIGAAVFSVLSSYTSYKNTKSVTITTLFDFELNPIEGSISKNIFDSIKEHANKEPSIIAETINVLDGEIIWGNYDEDVHVYYFYRFNN